MTATVPPSPSDLVDGGSRSARTRTPSRSASAAHAARPCDFVANEDDPGPLGLGATASISGGGDVDRGEQREDREPGAGDGVARQPHRASLSTRCQPSRLAASSSWSAARPP